jgi:hypothetical protein
MTHMRMIWLFWLCLALVVVGIGAAAAGLAWGYLLIVIPCVVMIGAMAWMVLFGPDDAGGTTRR